VSCAYPDSPQPKSFVLSLRRPLPAAVVSRRRSMRALYTIHVRRQNGVWQTERKVRPGRLPKEGETVSITLGTEVVKARVLNVIEERRELLYEVHAAEI